MQPPRSFYGQSVFAALLRPVAGLLSPGMWRIVAATLFLSLNSVCIKYAGREANVFQIAFIRSVVGMSLCMAFAKWDMASLFGHNKPVLILRGVLGMGAMITSFYAFMVLPVAEATVLFFMNPVFVALLAWIFLGETLPLSKMLFVLLSFAGVLLVAQPDMLFGQHAVGLDMLGVTAALVGALLAAGAWVCIRALGASERTLSPVFYLSMITVLCTGIPAVYYWTWGSWDMWICLLAIGLLTHMGQYFMTRGLSMEKAGRGSAVGYFQVVFATLWGVIFFGQYPDLLALFGTGLVMSGTLGLRERPRGAPNS